MRSIYLSFLLLAALMTQLSWAQASSVQSKMSLCEQTIITSNSVVRHIAERNKNLERFRAYEIQSIIYKLVKMSHLTKVQCQAVKYLVNRAFVSLDGESNGIYESDLIEKVLGTESISANHLTLLKELSIVSIEDRFVDGHKNNIAENWIAMDILDHEISESQMNQVVDFLNAPFDSEHPFRHNELEKIIKSFPRS